MYPVDFYHEANMWMMDQKTCSATSTKKGAGEHPKAVTSVLEAALKRAIG